MTKINIQNNIHYKYTNEKPTDLIILCHGYGSNGKNMLDLAGYFEDLFEKPYFIAPNAPFQYEFASHSGSDEYQWYGLQDRTPSLLLSHSKIAERHLNTFIDYKLHELGLDINRLIMIGFSQGTMISLHTLLRRSDADSAKIIAFSGTIVAPDELEKEIKSRPQVCMIHGSSDGVVPISLGKIAHTYLINNKVSAEFHKIDSLQHSINDQCITIARNFLT